MLQTWIHYGTIVKWTFVLYFRNCWIVGPKQRGKKDLKRPTMTQITVWTHDLFLEPFIVWGRPLNKLLRVAELWSAMQGGLDRPDLCPPGVGGVPSSGVLRGDQWWAIAPSSDAGLRGVRIQVVTSDVHLPSWNLLPDSQPCGRGPVCLVPCSTPST